MKIFKEIKNRLKSRAAESLIETLASILIVALSAMILATLVMSAANIGKTSQEEISHYFTEEKNKIASREADGTAAIGVKIVGTGEEFPLGTYNARGTDATENVLRAYWP